jgi:hypothetical protein
LGQWLREREPTGHLRGGRDRAGKEERALRVGAGREEGGNDREEALRVDGGCERRLFRLLETRAASWKTGRVVRAHKRQLGRKDLEAK